MMQTQENVGKPHFGPDLDSLGPNPGRHSFFKKSSIVSHEILWSAIIIYNIRKK